LLLGSSFFTSIANSNPSFGQDNQAQVDVKNMIQKLEKKFKVSITMDAALLKEKNIAKQISKNVNIITAATNIENALHRIVDNNKLEFEKISTDFYIIKKKTTPSSDEEKENKHQLVPEDDKTKKVQGVVLGAKDKLPIPGVTVLIKGTTIGTATDFDGFFSIEVPADAEILVFSFIGMKTKEIAIKNLKTKDNAIYLKEDYFGLEEVVISGVAAATPQKNLTVTVKRVDTKSMENIQSSNAVSALQGRVGGLTIINGSGLPGNSAGVRLRGATSITGSNAPLVMVDGTIISISLSDLNFDDVESYEIVQGAAASALYGSRAANGVIVIKTKRGSNLKEGEVKTSIKTEYGIQELPRHLPLATHHPYKLADDWDDPKYDYTRYKNVLYNSEGDVISGSRSLNDPTHSYVDQAYKQVNDYQNELFQKGQYYSFIASISSKQKSMNYFISFEHNRQEGIFKYTDGYTRNNFSFTLDNYLTDKIKLSTSNHIIHTNSNNPGSIYSSLFGSLTMSPDVKLIDSIYPDGTMKLSRYPDPWQRGVVSNPLIPLYYITKSKTKNAFHGNTSVKYDIFKFLSASIKYAYEYRFNNSTTQYPIGYIGGGSYANGYFGSFPYKSFSQEFQPIIVLNYNTEDYFIKSQLSYKYESWISSNASFSGIDLVAADIYQFQNADPKKVSAASYDYKIVSIDYFGIMDLGFKDTYFLGILLRKDGSSLFGENQRWQTYYRMSGAVRLSNFIRQEWLDELKLSSAYGIAGLRPKFSQQYETWKVTNGMLFPQRQGNKDLRPEVSKEWETTLHIGLLNRISSDLTYAQGKTSDAIFLVPLASQYGYSEQWKNIGGLSSKTYTASLDAMIVKTNNFSWNAGLTYTRVRSKIGELGVPPFYQGPNNSFLVRNDSIYNIMYGYDWVRSLPQMEKQLPEGKTIDDYEINDEGYVVPKGSIGTNLEVAIPLDINNDGVKDKVVIGDGNADFQLDFSNNISFYGFNLGLMISWKQGGNIYNYSRQYLYRDLRAAEIDQYGKAEDQKKSLYYYQNFYNNTEINSYFVEDGTYLKIRELSLSYNLSEKRLQQILGNHNAIKGVRLSVQGRNLFTFTKYKGFDPEVAYYTDNHFFPFDRFTYPNFRVYTFSLKLQF
jgi:TonB-linked SusC/RagA family outer membrane protein